MRRNKKKEYVYNLNGDGRKSLDSHNHLDIWQLNKEMIRLDLWFRDLRDRIEDIEIYLHGKTNNSDGMKWDEYKDYVEYKGLEGFIEEE